MPQGVANMTGKEGFFPNGNFIFRENFRSPTLDYRWIGVRGPREDFVTSGKRGITFTPFAVNLKEVAPTSTLFYRQQHNNFTATATMQYKPQSEKDLAGMVCYQSERFYYLFGITKKGKQDYLVLQRTERGSSKIVASVPIDTNNPVSLQVTANGNDYRFNYATGGIRFENLGGTLSGDILSTNVAGGFTGTLIGLHATTKNDAQPE